MNIVPCHRRTNLAGRRQGALVLATLIVAWLVPATGRTANRSMAITQELDLEYSFGGGAATWQNGQPAGSVNEHHGDVKYVVSPQVTNNLLLRFGAEWERFSFGVPATSALPATLQQVSAVIGCDYQLADQWLMRAEVQPGIYGDAHEVSGRTLDAPLVLGAAFLKDADLQWFFGLRLDVRSQYPVLPAIGIRWKFADDWTLNLQLPQPRLEYDVNDKLQAYLGARILAGTFVVNDHFGDDHGRPQLNHATLDYHELRVGTGGSWKIRPNLTLEAEAGCLLGRCWDFFDQHVRYNSREAPYLQIAAHARF